ncbi:MAG: hypothetical protein K0Q73_5537 [Paenibacillus sp.]|jgi:hypothetical protein|nr:hypothetical protein [Paenibacillus sp.]
MINLLDELSQDNKTIRFSIIETDSNESLVLVVMIP